ncbi:MAG: hypothetical protein ACM3SP_07965 [Chloroflexota bacterium]
MRRKDDMKSLRRIILCLVLTAPTLAAAAAKDEPPNREMLKMMDFLREMEMIKQMDMLQDMQNIENAGELAKSGAPSRSVPGNKKETVK